MLKFRERSCKRWSIRSISGQRFAYVRLYETYSGALGSNLWTRERVEKIYFQNAHVFYDSKLYLIIQITISHGES